MTMTDETYAVNCTVDGENKRGRKIMFFLRLFLAGAIGWLAQ